MQRCLLFLQLPQSALHSRLLHALAYSMFRHLRALCLHHCLIRLCPIKLRWLCVVGSHHLLEQPPRHNVGISPTTVNLECQYFHSNIALIHLNLFSLVRIQSTIGCSWPRYRPLSPEDTMLSSDLCQVMHSQQMDPDLESILPCCLRGAWEHRAALFNAP